LEFGILGGFVYVETVVLIVSTSNGNKYEWSEDEVILKKKSDRDEI